MRPESYPGISEIVRHVGPNTQRVHVLPCACCDNTVEVPVCGRRKPLEILHKIAKHRGWTIRRKDFFCPEHAQ